MGGYSSSDLPPAVASIGDVADSTVRSIRCRNRHMTAPLKGAVNMRNARRIGWILVGVLIGGGSSALFALNAQTARPQQRVQVIFGNSGGSQNFYFVKDSKSGGCWLMATSSTGSGMNQPVSLATAPANACEPK
jgi:hypothetical protein